ncbi:3-hydroxyacyl-CoA dehydrogenase NAD-binding domain-containing protein [Thermodesulfobacteriota bacterium]
MAFTYFGREIQKVGVIGSGNIGPDIAIHLSQNLFPYEVPIIVVGRRQVSLDSASKKIEAKMTKIVQKGILKKKDSDAVVRNILYTTDYSQLSDIDFVMEAAPERVEIKQRIFEQCQEICSKNTILASNSSHIIPEEIFRNVADKSRCLVIHYFFPAERNLLVEIVPSKETDPDLTEFLMRFYEFMGKAPIKVKSQYGFAVNPIFGSFFLSAILCVEKGLASVKQAEAITSKALGLGIGPFMTHNLSGGNPLSQHCLPIFGREIMQWYHSPKMLDEAVKTGESWDIAQRRDVVEYSPETYEAVSSRVIGAYLGVACKMLENEVANISDLDLAVEFGLDITPPFKMMNQMGVKKALEIVNEYANENPGFIVADILSKQAAKDKPWEIPVVLKEDIENVAVLKIRRPKMLNALNNQVYDQLQDIFENIKKDEDIEGVVLTGFGTRAFVSGADIGMLASLKTPEEAEALSLKGHTVMNLIENLGKPVVCAMNGLAFGGGNELAMSCTARVAKKGLQVFASQPEPLLGIIPGNGGTQRLPRLVGIEKAWPILRNAKPISSTQAKEIGLIDEEVDGDLIAVAIEWVKKINSKEISFQPIEKGPISIPTKLPDVDIGHLSLKIDALLQQAILEGAKLPLAEGLKLEAKIFGECLLTEDMRIGMDNFIKNGPNVNAPFTHK